MASIAQRRHAAFLAWMQANSLNSSQVAKHAGIPYTTINSYEKSADGATKSLRGDTEAKIAEAYDLPVEAIFGFGDPGAEIRPNNLRAWREFRGMSPAGVAQAMATTPSVIKLLEGGGATVSLKWLYKFAEVFGVNAGTIADFRPSELPLNYLQSLPAHIPPVAPASSKAQAKTKRTGTGG